MGVTSTVLRIWAYRINRLLWIVLVAALVLVATYVSVGRYYITYVEQYQHYLIERFVNYTGLPLTAQRLHGRWSRLSPILTMQNLALHPLDQDGEPVLMIDEVHFQLDPLASLLSGSLQVKQLGLTGVDCELEEIEPGKWQLKGYPAQAGETDFDKVIDLVLSVDSVQLLTTTLKMFYLQGNTALLESKELSLLHEGDFRRLRLQATFDKAANPLFAVIEAQGDPREAEFFSARAYLKLDDVDFTDQLPLIRSLGVNLHDAEVDSEVWVDWKPHRVISIQGTATIAQIDWAAITDSVSRTTVSKSTAPKVKASASTQEKPPLENVQLSFRAEKSANNDWQLWLPTVHAQWNEQTFSIEKLHAGINSETINLAVPTISLDKLVAQIVDLNVLEGKAESRLHALSPIGNLHNVHIHIALQDEQQVVDNNKDNPEPSFQLMANLDQVGISAWNGAPGAKGVSGFIEVTPSYGVIEFNSQQLSLDFPVVYKHWLDFDQASGKVRWDIGKERVTVKSGPLHLQADYGPATGLLSLDLPLSNDKNNGDPLMTLAIGLRDTAAHHRDKLIPYTLNQGFLDWVAQSVPNGHVIDGAFIYRGSLLKKAHDERTVQLYFNIENTTLDYHSEWPKLHDINALVLIDNAVVDVTTQQAKMFGLTIDSAHVQVKPSNDGGMWLAVEAEAEGDGADALKIITQSAIHDIVGSVFDNWTLQGATKASVKLGIPLVDSKEIDSKNKADINVSVSLHDNQLQIPDYRLTFNRLSGPLHFSSGEGLISSGLHAELYGKPLNITVESAQDKSVLVDINGHIDMADVASWSQQPAMTFVSGDTDFNAKVFIEGSGGGRFSVNSDLVGVSIDLPVPFNKSKEHSHAFWLTLPLSSDKALLKMGLENSAQLQVQLKRGDFSSALLNIETDVIQAKSVVPNSNKHEAGFFTVTGSGPRIQLHEWQTVLDRYLNAAQLLSAKTSSSDIPVRVRGLSLAGITGFGHSFERSVVSAKRRKQSWWLAITNSLTSGELVIPDDKNKPYNVDLQRLYFPEKTEKDEGLSSLDPTNFIDVDISIADVAFGNEHYGSIAFNLRSDNQGARLENLTGNIRGVHIREKNPGIMLWKTIDGKPQSHFIAQLDVGNLGKVLENWSYEKIIESDAGVINVDLHWQGHPDQWKLKVSEGSIDVKVKKGRFFAASKSTSGTLKVVGIVNLTNIIRRLRLDFTDFFKSGISFDSIAGQLKLADAQLNIVDEMTIKSPSSGFRIHGNADLEKELLDMEMIVTLPVANNLPWIAALAGGLPTAAGVFVASKIFKEQFNRLSSAVYTVKGDWNHPELKFKRVFDQKKKTNNKKPSKKSKQNHSTLDKQEKVQ